LRNVRKDFAVNAGLASVAIRSTGEAGDVKVVAKGKRLNPGELHLKSYIKTRQ